MSGKEEQKHIGLTEHHIATVIGKTGLKLGGKFPQGWTITLPYLPIEMFDVQGVRKSVTYIMRLLEQCDWFGPSRFEDPGEYIAEYILHCKFDISKQYYQKERFCYPLEVVQKQDYVKRTSRLCSVQLRESGNPSPLVTNSTVYINIDSITKRPKAYPEKWKRELNTPSEGATLVFRSPVKPVSNVLVEERTVRFTDVDENNHANYTVYVRMCLDAFYENILREKYPTSSQVFLNGWVKTITIVFKRDSVLGDTLSIESWQDGQYESTYHFELYNRGEVAVAITLEFYPSLAEPSRL